MKRINTFVKTSLFFTAVTLLINYFDFDGMVRDGKRTRRKVRRWF